MSIIYKIFLLILALPCFLAFAYDANRYYAQPEQGFKLRATGFFWVNFSPDTFKAASESIDPETWRNINKVLIIPGVYVAGVFSLVLYAFFGAVRGRRHSGIRDMDTYSRLDFLRDDGRKSKGYTYKRKR